MEAIRGEKVYIRLIGMEDTDCIVKWRNNPRVRNNFIYREEFTRQGHEAWMNTRVKNGEVVQCIICENKTDKPVGSVYLRDINHDEKKAEYGIFIGEDDATGKGYGNEAADLMCRYAKDNLLLKVLILRVFADNIPARKSYEHAGFFKTQDLPGVECSDGEVRDMILMEKSL